MTIYQVTAKIPSEQAPAVIYNSSLQNDRAYALIDPTFDGECGKAGSFKFDIPYGHPYWNKLTKLTTEIVFTQDNEELFRGRVYEIVTDIETKKSVTCEGNLSYLVDSLQPPDRVTTKDTHTVEYESEDGETSYSKEYSMDKEKGTKETLEAHFRRLIAKHNQQIESWKQFTVGDITIDNKNEEVLFDDSSYRDTLDALESDLIDYYGGWLRTRRVGNTSYIDWLKDYGSTSTQTFNFGQNIVKFDYTSNAEDLFTILVPIGDDGLTIASVNSGNIGIENANGIATYGRIYKTETFSGVSDAAKLKSLGESYMARNYKDPRRTVSVTAIDMHLLDPSVRAFHLGDKIQLIAPVQGINETIECLSCTITPNSPENNTYELGDRDESMSQRWTKDSDRNARGAANAGKSARVAGGGAGQLFKYMWEQERDLFANYDKIHLTANQVEANIRDLRVISGDLTRQGTRITQNEGSIQLFATKTGIDSLEEGETLFSKITVTANAITSVVSKTGVDELAPGETLKSKIEQSANKIEMIVSDVGGESKIKAASIVAEINRQTGTSQVKLSADQIDLDGLINLLRTKTLVADTMQASSLISKGSVTAKGSIMAPAIYLGDDDIGVSIGTGLYDVKIESAGNNTYVLKALTFNDRSNWVDKGTFSRATTLSGAWSSGAYTVTASPQGNTISTEVSMGPGRWDSNTPNLYMGDIYYSNDGGDNAYPTGATYVVDATSRYNAGYDAGRIDGSVTTLGGSWNSGTFTVTASPQGNTMSAGLFDVPAGDVTWNGNTASFPVKANLDGGETAYNTGKTLSIDATARYNAGYTAGQSDGGLAIDYNNNNISATNSQTKVAYIQAAAGISYNSTTHKYTATGKARVAPSGSGYSDMDTATAVSGTEAYDSGVTAGYGSARLSFNTANHTVNIGNTGSVVTGSVSADGIIGEFSGESMAYPVTIQAKINSTVMAEKVVWVEAFIPEEGGDYQTGYDRGYAAGLAAARIKFNTSRGTISIGTGGNRTEVGVIVSGTVGNWDSNVYRCPVTIRAVVDGVTMATGTVYVYNPNG